MFQQHLELEDYACILSLVRNLPLCMLEGSNRIHNPLPTDDLGVLKYYKSFVKFCEPVGIRIEILTGNLKKIEKLLLMEDVHEIWLIGLMIIRTLRKN